MRNPIDHERCSELLPAWLAGDLADQETRAVDDHLRTCSECRSERAWLEAIRPFEGPELSDEERARLRASVQAAIAGPGAEQPSAPAGKVLVLPAARPLRDRIGRALGIAALLLVLSVGGYYAATSMTGVGGDDGGGSDSAAVGGGGSGSAPQAAPSARARPLFAGGRTVTADQAKEGTERTAKQLWLQDTDRDSLVKLGGGPPFTRLAAAYTSDQIPELAPVFTDDLAGQAPSAKAADQVRDCAAEVSSAATSPQLPAYASLTMSDEQPVFVIGFVYASGPGAAHPDGFTLWVYPRGSCDQPIEFVSGRVGDD